MLGVVDALVGNSVATVGTFDAMIGNYHATIGTLGATTGNYHATLGAFVATKRRQVPRSKAFWRSIAAIYARREGEIPCLALFYAWKGAKHGIGGVSMGCNAGILNRRSTA
jgi:hypothetical protein